MVKGLIITLVIIFLVIIGAITFVFLYKDTYYHNKAVKDNNPSICGKIGREFKSANCYAAIAIANNDLQICVQSPKLYIMSCFQQTASANVDITLCKGILPEVDEYNCYTAFAGVYGETSVCNSLQGEPKDYCYKSVALQTNDASVCDMLPEGSVYIETCKTDVENLN